MKIKSRSLLTVILALLCAAAVALGIGFALPKVQKINANAATVPGSVSTSLVNRIVQTPGYVIDPNYGSDTEFRVWENDYNSSVGIEAIAEFKVKISVPAYTQYKVSLPLGVIIKAYLPPLQTGGAFNGYVWLTRYKDDGSVAQTLIAHTQLPNAPAGVSKDNIAVFSNLMFTNNTGSATDCYAKFSLHVTVTSKSSAAKVAGFVWVEDSATNKVQVEVTDLSKPALAPSSTVTCLYDGDPHTLNFTYPSVIPSTDQDGIQHSYDAYQNLDITVSEKDLDGNPASTNTKTLDNTNGTGSITATDAGIYTVTIKLKPQATGNYINWSGGGTDPVEFTLTINKINPTVNPVFGQGTWYTNNDLYNDISIATTAGDTAGTISWDSGKTLTAGTNNYGWTFTPTDTRNYNKKTGAEPITVANITITGISATFNPGTFYTSNKLDDLKARLAVDKVYNNGDTSRLADADYTLSVAGNKLVAGTNTVTVKYTTKNTEDPAFQTFNDTFTVEITAVEITAIAATFNPGTNGIYLSNSLNDLKQYLTVDADYNDGSHKTNITDYTITSPSALSLGTVTVTVTSDEDNTISDTFTVNVIPDIVPVQLPLPQANDYTYSGEELDVVGALTTLTEQDVIKYLDVTGTDSARRAGEYTVKFKIKDEFINAGNVSWDTSNLSSLQGVTVSADGNSVEFKWNILKAKVAATWDDEECIWVPVIVGTLAETTEPNFLVQTYTNSDGKAFKNRSKLAGGRTYQVTATINAKYADNFEFDDATQTLIDSGDETYTYTPPYVPSLWEKIVAFLKKNWLWLVIAAAALILLIIIIVVAKKCHKTKEQREEIKARKEEERRRKEEERQRREEERRLQQERLEEERRLQREKLEAEREMARAKQEAELEKIRAQAQAGMAGAGMATMAMAQQQPVQQVQTVDNDFLKEMRQQMAELRADNKATQEKLAALQNQQAMPTQMPMAQPMYQQYPQYQPQYGDPTLARLEAQINAMQIEQRARYDAEQRIELAAMRAEQHVDRDSRHSVDLAAMREHFNGKLGYSNIPDYSQANSIDALGAIVAAALKNMANGEVAATQVPELPQKSEQEAVAKYPSDAVITTTTTVDTTKNKSIRREENSDFDIDGFYDSIEE